LRQLPIRKCHWLFIFILTLNACTGVSVKQAGPADEAAVEDRKAKLNATTEWGLSAKISLDDGQDGGSGKLNWEIRNDRSELDFHGAFGRGAWNLQIGPDDALLKMSDGSEQAAASVSELIRVHLGWPVPLDALQWWVRGLAAPGDIEGEELSSDGLLISLRQFGWNVDFSRYDSVEGLDLPVRLNANRDNYRVKLAISQWRMDVNHGPAR
jgi:outer membrane lipoprotein LolB